MTAPRILSRRVSSEMSTVGAAGEATGGREGGGAAAAARGMGSLLIYSSTYTARRWTQTGDQVQKTRTGKSSADRRIQPGPRRERRRDSMSGVESSTSVQRVRVRTAGWSASSQ